MNSAVADDPRPRRWLGLPARHPWATLLIVVLCALLAFFGARRHQLQTTLDSMFPENDPAATALLRVLNNFGAAEELLVLVTLPPSPVEQPPEVARLLDYAARLETAVRNDPQGADMCEGVIYRSDADTRRFYESVLVPAGMFYLDPAGFAAARQRLTKDDMQRQIAQNEALIAMPGPAATAIAKITLQDPLRLHEFILDHLTGQRPFKTYQNSDAFVSPDGRSLLIRLAGKHPPSDLEFAKAFTARVQTLADQVNADHLDVRYAGAYAIATASERAIRHDMTSSVFSSIIYLQLLFLVAYRRPLRLFALAFAPVAVGTLLGFGLHSLITTNLTPMTAVIGAILAGLGVDYSINFLARYELHRTGGFDPRQAAQQTLVELSPPLAAAWATSVLGFLAIGCSSVRALRDFAILGSLGLLGAFLATLAILPAMLVLTDRRTVALTQSRPLRRFGIATPLEIIARRRGLSIAVSLAIVLGATGILLRAAGDILPLEDNLNVMHPQPNAPLETQALIAQRFGTDLDSLIVHLHAATPTELLVLAHRVKERLTAESAQPQSCVARGWGLADLLPDPRIVTSRLAAIAPGDAERVEADFHQVIAASSFAPEAYEPYAQFLHQLLSRRTAPGMDDLRAYRGLARMLLPHDCLDAGAPPPTEAIMFVFLRQPLDNRAARDAAVEHIRAALADLPGATLTGLSVIRHDTEGLVHRELPKLIPIALLANAIYLLIQFRSWLDALLAMVPAVASLLILPAVMNLTGQKLNMVNLIAIPLLIGIDVDYGILLVSLVRPRRRETPAARLRRFDSGGHAIILCAGATILGFGSLYFTSVPAIASLGFAAAVGIAACLGACLFLLVPIILGKRF